MNLVLALAVTAPPNKKILNTYILFKKSNLNSKKNSVVTYILIKKKNMYNIQ